MPKFQRSLARRIFVTAHKLILDSLMHRQLRRLKGRVLVVGAGFEALLRSDPNGHRGRYN